MKSVLKSVLALGVLFVASTGFSADITGTWNIGPTKCLSGAALNPAASTLAGTFAFTATSVTLTAQDQGCTIVIGPAAATYTADKITPAAAPAPLVFTCPGQAPQTSEANLPVMDYVVNGDVLTLTAPPEPPDAACPAGDHEVIDLTKVK